MKTNGYWRWTFAVLLTTWAVASAHGEYTMHGRVSFDGGATLVRGAEESDWSQATVNTLVLPGDLVWADEGGMVEMELPRGGFLRMADGSKVELVGLDPDAALRGWVGSYYIQRLSRASGDFRFVTPACEVEIAPDTAVRIDVVEDGATTVTVRWGRAVVHADSEDITVLTTGRRVWVDPGFMPSFPVTFDSTEDDAFDRWNRERAEWLATGGKGSVTSRPIEDDIIGLSDLDNYGEWVVLDSRPVWRPTVVTDYVPYRYGRWSYTPSIGNVWVGHYPFAYTTSHYGRWNHTDRYGWVWGYDPVWSPAWAATVRMGDYFAWSPIGYNYQPVYSTSWSYFSVGDLRFGHYATSYVRASDLYMDYSYVRYADPLLFTQGFVSIHNPHIWRIHPDTGYGRRGRIPYSDGLRYASYTPSRMVRGLTTLSGTSRSVSDRARRLESRPSRGDFSRAVSNSVRGQRTATGDSDRSARVRTLRVARETPSYVRATRNNPLSAARDVETQRVTRERSRSDRGDGEALVGRRSVGASDRTPARPVRESGTASTVGRSERTPTAATRVRRETARGQSTSSSNRFTDRQRTESAPANRREATTTRSSRTEQRPVIRRESTADVPSRTPRSGNTSVRSNTPDSRVRTTVPERSTTRRQVPSNSSSRDRTSTRPRVVTREGGRTNEANTMVRREVSRSGATPSSTARTPSQTSVRRSIPTVRTPSTRTREPVSTPRAAERTQESAPRSSARRTQEYTAPSRTSAPAVSRSSSRLSSPPQVTRRAPTAPTRSTTPNMTRSSRPAPTPRVAPSTPSRSRVSTPSTSSRSRVSTPSTSTGTRSTAPSGRAGSTRGGRR